MSGIKGGIAVNDYIERRAAIDAFWPVDPENDGSDGCTVVLQNQRYSSDEIESIISGIPAADVRPVVRGRWIKSHAIVGIDAKTCDVKIGETDKCSECGEEFVRPIKEYKFCPSCGADMREGNEK